MRKPTESDKNHDLHVIEQIVDTLLSKPVQLYNLFCNYKTLGPPGRELPRPNRLWLESQWISLNGVHAKDLKKIHSRKDIL